MITAAAAAIHEFRPKSNFVGGVMRYLASFFSSGHDPLFPP
jgi:hypothetical protein